jgi:hypothetical protein
MKELNTLKKIDINDKRWINFIEDRPEADIFHTPHWANNLAQCYGYKPFALVLEKDGKITAGLSVMEVNNILSGRRWVSLPYTDHCAPLFENDLALNQLTDALVSLSQQPSTPGIELRWGYPQRPEIKLINDFVLHGGRLINPDELFPKFDRPTRRRIKASIHSEVIIEEAISLEYLQRFYNLLTITRRKHGVPIQPWNYFRLLYQNLLQKGFGSIILISMNREDLAGQILLHYKNTMTLKYAGATSTSPDSVYPYYLLYWKVMQWGYEHGLNTIDFGRSDVENLGLRDFKNKWMVTESPLPYSYLGKFSQNKDSKLLNLLATIIHHSPLWVSRFFGEFLYKYFG